MAAPARQFRLTSGMKQRAGELAQLVARGKTRVQPHNHVYLFVKIKKLSVVACVYNPSPGEARADGMVPRACCPGRLA